MDHIEKLFRKISADERALLSDIVKRLTSGETNGLNIKKLSGSDFYRLRKGIFRIIFHYENKIPIVDSIRIKNEKTCGTLDDLRMYNRALSAADVRRLYQLGN